tara:strand:+ start:118 stop:687 length:570 start_codon:yes stop_codon:yes gene_type:complete
MSEVQHHNYILHWLQSRGWFYYFTIIVCVSTYRLGIFTTTGMDGLRVGKIELQRGSTLHQNEYISACVGFSDRFCTPMYLVMQDNGQLKLFKGYYKDKDSKSQRVKSALKEDDDEIGENELLWQSSKHKLVANIQKTMLLQEYKATVSVDGGIAIYRGGHKRMFEIWSMTADELMSHPVLSKSVSMRIS